jgi:hypothetical protein
VFAILMLIAVKSLSSQRARTKYAKLAASIQPLISGGFDDSIAPIARNRPNVLQA